MSGNHCFPTPNPWQGSHLSSGMATKGTMGLRWKPRIHAFKPGSNSTNRTTVFTTSMPEQEFSGMGAGLVIPDWGPWKERFHVCIYLYVYIHIQIHIQIHIHIHTHIHIIAYIHTYIHAYMHTCKHAYMHTCMHAYIHTYVYFNYMYIYIHMYVYKYIYIHN